TSDGSFSVEAPATLNLGAGTFTFTDASAITGDGTVILNGNTTVAGTYDLGTGTTKVPNTFVQVNFLSPVTSVGSSLVIDGYVNFSGGLPIAVDTLSLTTFGTLTGSDDVTVTGSLSWNGGVMSGPGSTTVTDGATLTFGGSQYANLVGRNFTTFGVTAWVGN